MQAIDFGKIPVIRFHLVFAILYFSLAYWVFLKLPASWFGFLGSSAIQFIVLELQFIGFKIWKYKSGLLQAGIILGSFFGNLLFLVLKSSQGGSNFILGFFLAYFGFLTIFVISAIASKKVVRGTL